MTLEPLPPRLARVAELVPKGASVLDVGCADGLLLRHLRDARGVDGRGIELDPALVAEALAHGLSVVQGDADTELAQFPTAAVDYAILSEALQAMRAPDRVLTELLRIGRRAIVAFPNFGHWRVRLDLLLTGRMPVTPDLPASWYATPNIHLCTIRDFEALVAERGWRVEARRFTRQNREVRWHPNLWADHALYVLAPGP
ncbi:MAG: methionine biosynthesis protein MetW [Sphingomonadaceae bacterium]|uniref:methionine biosynthesis protein MetW n=1 Tax=Thermaurantiacus sp. TaxID=2820283 RepID=UPI00298F2AAD|nr:methionine biosynthesis protein MetW [Thermaurantiacus sp.]MCS6986647.1 methionine biosynthesis protein MetW [Sphingomonadaceae bacterium]MDW8414091.1 methionine biosynthesis protein MetW [Thermaurantiacus sp.]